MRLPTPPAYLRLGLAVAFVAIVATGCGSSSSSTTTSNTSSEAAANAAIVAKQAAEASENPPPTAAAKALYTEPKVTVPSGPAPSQLVIKEIIKGTGPVVKAGDHVQVHYVGVLYSSGKKFESSFSRHEPLAFTLGEGRVIPGWEKGFVGMRLYGRRELIIPPSLAYGTQGSEPTIPPNETLVFVVDLVHI